MARSEAEYLNEVGGFPSEDRTLVSIGTITSMPAISMGALAAGTNNIGYVGIYGGTITATLTGTQDVRVAVGIAAGTNILGKISDCVNAAGSQNMGYVGIYGGTVFATLGAGTNTIGKISDAILATGSQNIGYVGIYGGTVFATLGAGTNTIGKVSDAILATGSQYIGKILPSDVTLAAGSQYIGSLGTGTNTIGKISDAILATGSQYIGKFLPSDVVLGAGSQYIGSLGTGTNNIGYVGVYGGTINATVNNTITNAGTITTVPSGLLPDNRSEYWDRDVQTTMISTATLVPVTLSQGTTWSVKEVWLYTPQATATMLYSVVRGTSTLGNFYYGCTSVATFDKVNFGTGSLIIAVTIGQAGTLMTTARYYYY